MLLGDNKDLVTIVILVMCSVICKMYIANSSRTLILTTLPEYYYGIGTFLM